MVTDNVGTGAGTRWCEGTRERKKSEMTEQGLLPNRGGEAVQGQRSREEPTVLRRWQPGQPRQVGARPARLQLRFGGALLTQGLASLLPPHAWLCHRISECYFTASVLPLEAPGSRATFLRVTRFLA